ncbi:MAG: hypothetical protein ACI90U_000443 [Pseudomonadales bacterium]|jgi:hypothetical protein
MLEAIVIAAVFTVLGLLLGRTDIGSDAGQQLVQIGNSAKAAILDSAIDNQIVSARDMLFIEYPELLPAIAKGGAFGGDFSRLAAQSMFGRFPDAIKNVKSKTTIDNIASRTRLIKMPIVNAVLFETDAGLILIDTGMAPVEPAIVE